MDAATARLTSMPWWIRLAILGWSLATIAVAIVLKAGVTRSGSGSRAFGAAGPWLWPCAFGIALAACGLAYLVARRGRVEVALALAGGLGLFALVLVWLRYVI